MQHYLLPRQDRHPRHVVQGGGGGPHIQPRHETRTGAVSYRASNDGSRRLRLILVKSFLRECETNGSFAALIRILPSPHFS